MKIINKLYSMSLAVFLLISYANMTLAVSFDSGFVDPTRPAGVTNTALDVKITSITNWILGFAAAVSMLMIIAGGFIYMASAGDQTKADSGKKTVSNGILGLVIAGLSFAIVQVIIDMVA